MPVFVTCLYCLLTQVVYTEEDGCRLKVTTPLRSSSGAEPDRQMLQRTCRGFNGPVEVLVLKNSDIATGGGHQAMTWHSMLPCAVHLQLIM